MKHNFLFLVIVMVGMGLFVAGCQKQPTITVQPVGQPESNQLEEQQIQDQQAIKAVDDPQQAIEMTVEALDKTFADLDQESTNDESLSDQELGL